VRVYLTAQGPGGPGGSRSDVRGPARRRLVREHERLGTTRSLSLQRAPTRSALSRVRSTLIAQDRSNRLRERHSASCEMILTNGTSQWWSPTHRQDFRCVDHGTALRKSRPFDNGWQAPAQLQSVDSRHRHGEPEVRVDITSQAKESACDPSSVRPDHGDAPAGLVRSLLKRAESPRLQGLVTLTLSDRPQWVLPAVAVVPSPLGGWFNSRCPLANFFAQFNFETE